MQRLLALGASTRELDEQLGYVRPAEPLGDHSVNDLLDNVEDVEPGLVVLDGVNSALTREGAELNSNRDFVAWWQRLILPLQRAAPETVLLTVDQVSKDKDARDYAIGASQKLALIDGSAFRMITINPFGRSMRGSFAIHIAKDRPGALRQHANGNQIAMLSLSSQADGSVRWELSPATEVGLDGDWRPTWYMEQVSIKLLATMPGQGVAAKPMTQAAILAAVGGKQARVRQALELLIEDGYVTIQTGPRNSKLHTLVRPFTANENLEKFENASTE